MIPSHTFIESEEQDEQGDQEMLFFLLHPEKESF
jgi:hypothetical protein